MPTFVEKVTTLRWYSVQDITVVWVMEHLYLSLWKLWRWSNITHWNWNINIFLRIQVHFITLQILHCFLLLNAQGIMPGHDRNENQCFFSLHYPGPGNVIPHRVASTTLNFVTQSGVTVLVLDWFVLSCITLVATCFFPYISSSLMLPWLINFVFMFCFSSKVFS